VEAQGCPYWSAASTPKIRLSPGRRAFGASETSRETMRAFSQLRAGVAPPPPWRRGGGRRSRPVSRSKVALLRDLSAHHGLRSFTPSPTVSPEVATQIDQADQAAVVLVDLLAGVVAHDRGASWPRSAPRPACRPRAAAWCRSRRPVLRRRTRPHPPWRPRPRCARPAPRWSSTGSTRRRQPAPSRR
jgi:hypothetical protein